jgi:hypothetical protein
VPGNMKRTDGGEEEEIGVLSCPGCHGLLAAWKAPSQRARPRRRDQRMLPQPEARRDASGRCSDPVLGFRRGQGRWVQERCQSWRLPLAGRPEPAPSGSWRPAGELRVGGCWLRRRSCAGPGTARGWATNDDGVGLATRRSEPARCFERPDSGGKPGQDDCHMGDASDTVHGGFLGCWRLPGGPYGQAIRAR